MVFPQFPFHLCKHLLLKFLVAQAPTALQTSERLPVSLFQSPRLHSPFRNQVRVGRFKQQMIMVAHQTIRVNLPTRFLTGFRQGLNEIVPVHIVEEYVLASIPAAHDVVSGTWILDS